VSRRLGRLVAALVFLSFLPIPAARADERRLVWNEDWPRFRAAEYVVTGVLALGGLALEYGTVQADEPRWVGPLPGDGPIRDLFVGNERSTRQAADFASDLAWMSAQFYPQVVDAFVVAYALDGANVDVAWQLSWMNVEAMSVAFLLTRGSHRLFARERPLKHSCGSDAAYDELCPFRGTAASFVSGHVSMAFTGAGLTCVHHRYLPLYGSAGADLAGCLGVTTLATATGVLRLIADRHYASDVVAGALIGFGVGYGLPWLLHYRHGARASEYGAQSAALEPATTVVSWSRQF
jgi:membrane-associated phospholipid phosphatase